MPLHCRLSAEGTGVFGVLGDLHLLDLLSKRRSISDRRSVSFRNLLNAFIECAVGVGRAILLYAPGTIFPSHANLCSHD